MAATARAEIRSGSAPRGARPAGRCPGAARRVTCSGCGRAGVDRATAADLAITWLLPDPTDPAGPVRTARFCRGCAPNGSLDEITCAGCGDGPILAGVLAEPTDLATAAVVETWLTETGWHWRIERSAGPWCPNCSPAVAFRAGHRR